MALAHRLGRGADRGRPRQGEQLLLSRHDIGNESAHGGWPAL
jgi:hypothetical protein